MDELIIAILRLFFGSQPRRSAPPPIRRPGVPASPTDIRSPLLPQPKQMSAQDRSRAAAQSLQPSRRPAPPPIGGRRSPARRPVAMPPVMIAQPIVTAIVPGPGTTAPITKPLAAKVTTVKKSEKSKTIRSWMTPATLRKQYILTEILQPPVSLREPN